MLENNRALVSKLARNMLKKQDNLWVKMMKGKYLRGMDRVGASLVWQSSMKGRDILHWGMSYKVGHGRRISVWLDPWLPEYQVLNQDRKRRMR